MILAVRTMEQGAHEKNGRGPFQVNGGSGLVFERAMIVSG